MKGLLASYWVRLLADFLIGFSAEFVHATYNKAFNQDIASVAVPTSFILAYAAVPAIWFMKEPSWRRQLGYITACGAGYALATLIVIKLVSPLLAPSPSASEAEAGSPAHLPPPPISF